MRVSTVPYDSSKCPPIPDLRAHATRRASTSAGRAGLPGLHPRPGLIDPGISRRGITLRPVRRRRDVPDRNGDDPVRIENREWILGDVLCETGDRVFVTLMVVRAGVDVPAGARNHRALEHRDDRLVVRPPS